MDHSGPFTVAEHLIAQHSAIKMLHSRVKLILEYIKASEAGRTNVPTFLWVLGKQQQPHKCSWFYACRRGSL